MGRALYEDRSTRYVRPATELFRDTSDAAPEPEAHLDALISRAKSLLGRDYDDIHAFALNEQLADCREDLTEFGVVFDTWYSERSLYESGRLAQAIERLAAAGQLYEKDGAKWFRSTAFGDEKDRVVQRENGQYTYFASDMRITTATSPASKERSKHWASTRNSLRSRWYSSPSSTATEKRFPCRLVRASS
jgi:arginyl-tRNA synthetase